MRKLWIPFSLFLLLLLTCIWIHRESFGKPLHYSIIQTEEGYSLEGTLHSADAIQHLHAAFAAEGVLLDTQAANINALLEPRGSLALVETIIPSFVTRYHAGRIEYRDTVLVLSGSVEREEEKREVAQLLTQSPIVVKNRTTVVPPRRIAFHIIQKRGKWYTIEGQFSDISQRNRLLSLFQKHHTVATVASEKIDPQLTEKNRIMDKLDSFLPFFLSRVRDGEILYQEGKLTVKGKVLRKKEIEQIDAHLSQLNIETQNAVLLDIKAIRGKRAKRRARKLLKTLQQQRSKKAQIKKAEEEISRDIVAMMDTPKGKSAQLLSDNKKVRENLRTLFQTEIIKFNTAQTTLTPLGLGTVSKIAVILNTYPEVNIEIAGHTDSDGDDTFNMLLSQGRVNNVKRALMKEGIAKERIKAVGYGETKPLLPNTTEANKQKNRRVEIIVLGE